MHEYLLQDLVDAAHTERRLQAHQHRLAHRATRDRASSPRRGAVSRVLAHVRLRPAARIRTSEPAGA